MSKNRPHARRAARSRAFQVLYSLQFSPSTTLGDVRTAFLEMPDPTDADMDENAETREEKLYGFAWELVEGVWSNVKNLDSVIERFSQNWRVDRLGKIEPQHRFLLHVGNRFRKKRPDTGQHHH